MSRLKESAEALLDSSPGKEISMSDGSTGLALAALVIYVIGGVATFTGIGLLVFFSEQNVWGWGDGRSLGYLFICCGLVLTIAGVFIMRILRNRT